MTTAIVILSIVTLVLLVLVIYLYFSLRRTEKKIDKILEEGVKSRIECLKAALADLDKKISAKRVEIVDMKKAFQDVEDVIKALPEPLNDPDKLVAAFNKVLGEL